MSTHGPAHYPCASCPYRKDVPSGVWADDEYDKLPLYDGPTMTQPAAAFYCHQQNGRLCAGWCGTHDMDEALAIRFAHGNAALTEDDINAALDYVSPVELWESGEAAAEHGRAEIQYPGQKARRTIDKLERRRDRRQANG